MVNNRLAGLEERAITRRGNGQGVFAFNDNVNNDNMYNHNSGVPLPSRRISSGRDRTGNDGVARLFIPWPNEHCLIGVDRHKVRYDDLNQAQWHAGLMKILEMERDPTAKANMLRHIAKLSQDVVDCGYRVAKGAHSAVLVALEDGRVSWFEPEVIDGIRRDSVSRVYLDTGGYNQRSSSSGENSSARRTFSSGESRTDGPKSKSICRLFNNGTCKHDSDHTVGNVIYRHICSYCRISGKSYKHNVLECNKKQDKG